MIVYSGRINNVQDYIRDKWKSTTGTDMPLSDKKTTLDSSKD
jgi:hypothetical protein